VRSDENNQPVNMKKNCKICKKEFVGRSDKIFCSLGCKNDYNTRLRNTTKNAAKKIDNILHRNRSILLEIMGKHKSQTKINRIILDRKKFNFNYMTGYSINKAGKFYHHIYDFSYMTFSSEEVLIVRKRNTT